MKQRPLYHYTCDHNAPAIRAELTLRPNEDGLVWLTDLPWPRRDALGLTSHMLDCDRTANRFTAADLTGVIPFAEYAITDRIWAAALAEAPGAEPDHWWVCRATVPVVKERKR